MVKSQATFSVSPGFGLNGAQFGYKINSKLIPYVSFQYLNGNYKSTREGERVNETRDGFENFTEEDQFSGSIYIPTIGAKYFIKSNGQLKSFLQGGLSFPFASGSIEGDEDANEDLKESIDNVSIWGGELSFGVEYFFDENFSLGGEFGLRGFHVKVLEDQETTISYFDPDQQQSVVKETNTKYETKVNVSPTFSRISLNFYF